MALGDDYIKLLTHSQTTPTAAGGENKYVRTVRALVYMLDQLRAELRTVDGNVAETSVSGTLLTWIAAAIGEPRPPWINDDDLYLLLLARIAANTWRGDMETARALVQSLWPLADLQDMRNMTIQLTVPGEFLPGGSATGPSAKLYALSRIADAIRPSGVRLEVLAAGGKIFYWGTPADKTKFGGWTPDSGAIEWGGNYIITGA